MLYIIDLSCLKLKKEQKKLRNESPEVNQLLNLGDVCATDCEDLHMFQDARTVRQTCQHVENM